MSKTSIKDLEVLLTKVTEVFNKKLDEDLSGEYPIDAATLSSAVKFLKDNDVTATPANKEEIKGLKEKLLQKAEERRKAVNSNVIPFGDLDLE